MRSDQHEKSERLDQANEKAKGRTVTLMRHLCKIGISDQAEMPHYFGNSPFINEARVSTGIGKMVVEFFSPAISASV
ncbi:MAG: hypothetical protein NTAFB01_35040 [Nitrospira sp.]